MSDNLELAAQAVQQLFAIAGKKGPIGRPDQIVNSDYLQDIFHDFERDETAAAVAPTATYLLYVPMHNGSGFGSNYQSPRPNEMLIRKAISFLALMGNEQAIPALERIASTTRSVQVPAQGEWDYGDNEDEKETARRAIEIIRAIRKDGYKRCDECQGAGKVICSCCHGSGKVEQIEEQKILFIKRKVRKTVTCRVCDGQAQVTCGTCRGKKRLLPFRL